MIIPNLPSFFVPLVGLLLPAIKWFFSICIFRMTIFFESNQIRFNK